MKLVFSSTISFWIVPFVVLGGLLINYLVGPQPWPGEALFGVEWVWTTQFLVGPVIAAIAAVDGARVLGREPASLLGSRRLRRPFVWRWILLSTATASVPYLVATVVALALSPYIPNYALLSTLITPLLGTLTLAITLAVGAVIGSGIGIKLGPVVALATFLLVGVLALSGDTPVLMLGGPSASLSGLERSSASLILQGASLLAVAVLAWMALVVLPNAGRWRLVTASAVAIGLIFLVVPRLPVESYGFAEPSAEHLGCIMHDAHAGGEFPRISSCVTGEHVRLGDDIDQAFLQIHSAAAAAGIDGIPEEIVEIYPFTGLVSSDKATFSFSRDQLDISSERQPVDGMWLAGEIAEPRSCPALFADEPPSDSYWETVEQAKENLRAVIKSEGLDVEREARAFEQAWEKIKACDGAS